MARKKEPEEHGAESWLMSYCDMITLLVTFFLMMMTFSTKEKGNVTELGIGLLKGRGGVWPSRMGSSYNEELDRAVAEQMSRDLDDLIEKTGGSVALQSGLDGLIVHFDLECSFAPDSIEVPPKLRDDLLELAALLVPYDHIAVVEGSTDSEFQPTTRFPTAQSISVARACAAAAVMLEVPALAPERVQIAGFGTERPRASNDTEQGRRSNRGVDVRVLAMSKSLQAKADAVMSSTPVRRR
jgi:chemotaxis protein MotB